MSNEWVKRAMELVEAYADKTSEYYHALRIDVGTHEAGATCVRAGGALWAHLESREAEFQLLEKDITEFREAIAIANERMDRQEALVKQLAEALERTAQTLAWECFGECRSHSAAPLLTPSQADELARAALAAYQEKT